MLATLPALSSKEGQQTTNLYCVLAKDEVGVILTESNAAVLQWREDSCGNIDVVSVELGVTKEPSGQQLPGLNGQGGELCLAQLNIPNGVDVGNISLLIDGGNVTRSEKDKHKKFNKLNPPLLLPSYNRRERQTYLVTVTPAFSKPRVLVSGSLPIAKST